MDELDICMYGWMKLDIDGWMNRWTYLSSYLIYYIHPLYTSPSIYLFTQSSRQQRQQMYVKELYYKMAHHHKVSIYLLIHPSILHTSIHPSIHTSIHTYIHTSSRRRGDRREDPCPSSSFAETRCFQSTRITKQSY